MKTNCWILIEAFFLPGFRHRLPKIYSYIASDRYPEVVSLIREHIINTQDLLGRDLSLSEEDCKAMANFLTRNKPAFSTRLRAIRLRSKKEPDSGG